MRARESRRAVALPVSNFVELFDQIACLLIFDRQEVSRRGVDTLKISARRLRRTIIDVVGPESQTCWVRLPIQKINVVLADKKVYLIDLVAGTVWTVEKRPIWTIVTGLDAAIDSNARAAGLVAHINICQ